MKLSAVYVIKQVFRVETVSLDCLTIVADAVLLQKTSRALA